MKNHAASKFIQRSFRAIYRHRKGAKKHFDGKSMRFSHLVRFVAPKLSKQGSFSAYFHQNNVFLNIAVAQKRGRSILLLLLLLTKKSALTANLISEYDLAPRLTISYSEYQNIRNEIRESTTKRIAECKTELT